MGIEFNIITDNGTIIKNYSIKWLFNYDTLFCYHNSNTNIKEIILYCNKQIDNLKYQVDEFNNIKKIKCLEFDIRKDYLISLIKNTNNNEEIDKLIENIYIINYETCDYEDNNLILLENFVSFRLFLENNQEYKYELSF